MPQDFSLELKCDPKFKFSNENHVATLGIIYITLLIKNIPRAKDDIVNIVKSILLYPPSSWCYYKRRK